MSAWRRRATAAGVAAAVILAGTAFWAAAVVARARRATPELVASELAVPGKGPTPEELAAWQLEALLAVQDPGFYRHPGWDFAGGTMTTISQALVKRLYFDRFRPGFAKIEQSLIARFALDPLVSKRDQLALFLATVYLGSPEGVAVNGLAAGAETYHGKPFAELSRAEFLSLLATLDHPNRLDRRRQPQANTRRVEQIERLLAGECRRPGLLRRRPHCFSEEPAPAAGR